MKVFMISRKLKRLSQVLIGFFTCSLLVNYLPDFVITYGGRERAGVSTHVEEERQMFESVHLKLVMTVVVPPKNNLKSVAQMINSTWGAEALGHYRLAVGNTKKSRVHSTYILQATECSDLVLDQPKQLYCLLKAIYHSYVNEYKWFLVASELIYVSMQKLERYLIDLNPNAFVYMGERVHDPTLGHHYCSMRAGLLLSRKALQTIVRELEGCLLSGGPGEASDAVLGWCVATVLHQTCWEFNENFNKLEMLSLSDELSNRLIFDSIQDAQEMNDIHAFTRNKEVTYYFEKIKELCNSIHSVKNSMCDSLLKRNPFTETDDDVGENQIETKMIEWDMIRGRQLFSSTSLLPSQHLHGDKHTELLQIQAEAFDALKKMHTTSLALIGVLNCYIRYRTNVGREYIVDMLLQDVVRREVVQKRVSLVKPNMPEVIVIKDSPPEALEKRINFVVPAHNVVMRLKAFLKTYEAACLEEDGNCKLHIVMYDSKEIKIIMEEIKKIKQRHPNFLYNIVKGVGTFNRGKARDLGMSVLKDDEFAFMCDVDINVDKSFLNRCRQNALQGKRVYFPIVFKYYNMDFVYPGALLKPFYEVTERNGYWCIYGYGNICTYKSDYSMIGGFDPGFEGWGGEDTEIAEKALRRSVEVFRAPDPGLVHQFHFNNCSHLTGIKQQFCLGSRNKGLASKVQLADYVYKVKYGM